SAGSSTVADGEHATAERGDGAAIEMLPAQAGGCDRIDQVAHGQTQLRVSGDVVGGGIGGVHEVVPAQPRTTRVAVGIGVDRGVGKVGDAAIGEADGFVTIDPVILPRTDDAEEHSEIVVECV